MLLFSFVFEDAPTNTNQNTNKLIKEKEQKGSNQSRKNKIKTSHNGKSKNDNKQNGSKKKKDVDIEESLFERIGKDDMVALEELYNLTERTMYAYILSIVKNHDETLDLMQETYIKIMSSAHLYKPMGKPLAWMFTIARNLYLSKIRKEKNERPLDSEILEDDLNFSYVKDYDDKAVLEVALNILTQEEREIIILYAVSGLKHKEIAESLGLKLSTNLSKYHRALKKIRDYFNEGGVGYE